MNIKFNTVVFGMFVSIFLFSIEASGSQSGQKGYIPKSSFCNEVDAGRDWGDKWELMQVCPDSVTIDICRRAASEIVNLAVLSCAFNVRTTLDELANTNDSFYNAVKCQQGYATCKDYLLPRVY